MCGGLKPVESEHSTSEPFDAQDELKLRPPKEKAFHAGLNSLWENVTKRRKSFLQGLKPVEQTHFTSALKHRPPEEKGFCAGLKR
jgi:hypothetical protein